MKKLSITFKIISMPVPKAKAEALESSEIKTFTQNTVYMEKSVTKNLGDYNSAKITVGVTVGVNPTKEEMKAVAATIADVSNFLDAEMEEQIKSLF